MIQAIDDRQFDRVVETARCPCWWSFGSLDVGGVER